MAGGRADSGHALPAGRGFTKQLSSAIIRGVGAPGVPGCAAGASLAGPRKNPVLQRRSARRRPGDCISRRAAAGRRARNRVDRLRLITTVIERNRAPRRSGAAAHENPRKPLSRKALSGPGRAFGCARRRRSLPAPPRSGPRARSCGRRRPVSPGRFRQGPRFDAFRFGRPTAGRLAAEPGPADPGGSGYSGLVRRAPRHGPASRGGPSGRRVLDRLH